MKKSLFFFVLLAGLVTTQVTSAMDKKDAAKKTDVKTAIGKSGLLHFRKAKKIRTAIPGNITNPPKPSDVMEVLIDITTTKNLLETVPGETYTYRDCIDMLAEELLAFLKVEKKDPLSTLKGHLLEMCNTIEYLKIPYTTIKIHVKTSEDHGRISFTIQGQEHARSSNNIPKTLLLSTFAAGASLMGLVWLVCSTMNP